MVDPDDHHLFASLGCATENLIIAATGYGLQATARFVDDRTPRIEVSLQDAAIARSALIDAIPLRQLTRSDYDGSTLSADERTALLDAASAPDVDLHFIEFADAKTGLGDLIIAGNTSQLENRAFVSELRDWIRFSASAAANNRDGLFAACTGNPTLPNWLGRLIFSMVLRTSSENLKVRRQIDSSAALAVFVSEKDEPANWVQTGRAFQHMALEATRLGLAHAHLNQAVEVSSVRAELARFLGIASGRPSLIVRLGRAAPMAYSLRRSTAAIIT